MLYRRRIANFSGDSRNLVGYVLADNPAYQCLIGKTFRFRTPFDEFKIVLRHAKIHRTALPCALNDRLDISSCGLFSAVFPSLFCIGTAKNSF